MKRTNLQKTTTSLAEKSSEVSACHEGMQPTSEKTNYYGMKKVAILLTFLIIATAIFAQKGKVTSALSLKESGEIEKAYQTISETIDSTNVKSENSINWPRTWQVRGQILQEIYKKEIPGLVNEPLFEAYYSFLKAIELDEKSIFTKSLIIDLTFLQTDLSNYAVTSYNKENYDVSLESFEFQLAINQIPIMKQSFSLNVLDTLTIYNAGLTAYKAKKWEKSIEYFTIAAKNDYNGASCYYFVYQSYQAQGDTLNSLNALKEGHSNYPSDETLLVQLINFYINKGRSDEALKYIDFAISANPENSSIYSAKGSMFEKIGNIEGAIEQYKLAIEKDSMQYNPYFNLSAIYYNRGVEVINSANQIPPNQTEKFYAEIEKAKENFKLSLPFIERAYQIDSTQIAILESLRTIYYRLQMDEKYMEINKKIQSLKN